MEKLCERFIEEYARLSKRTWRADQMRLKKDVQPRGAADRSTRSSGAIVSNCSTGLRSAARSSWRTARRRTLQAVRVRDVEVDHRREPPARLPKPSAGSRILTVGLAAEGATIRSLSKESYRGKGSTLASTGAVEVST